MGKQINYYMGYNEFIKLAQIALDCGCDVIKKENDAFMRSNNLDCITEDNFIYYFVAPQTDLELRQGIHMLSYYGKIIEAGFSKIEHKSKYITSGRIYVGSGMYMPNGEYVARDDGITKLYGKLSRAAKKLAPYTEVNDTITETTNDGHSDKTIYTHKEYISSECFDLWKNFSYRLK